MVINAHKLKTNPIYVNPDYLDKKPTFAICAFDVKETIDAWGLNRQLSLNITITFDSKDDKTNIIKADFSRFFDIQLHADENEHRKTYFNLFLYEIYDTFSEMLTYVDKNVPPEIVEAKNPLIEGYEKETTALSLYEKLIKPPVLK